MQPCNTSSFLGISASSSSFTSSVTLSPFSSQSQYRRTEKTDIKNLVLDRSRGTNGELRTPLQESTEKTGNPKYKDFSHEVLDWLQEFREHLVGKSSLTEPW